MKLRLLRFSILRLWEEDGKVETCSKRMTSDLVDLVWMFTVGVEGIYI